MTQKATPVTVSNGTSLSPAISIGNGLLVGIAMSAGWDAASLDRDDVTVEVSAHTGEFASFVRSELERLEPQVADMSDDDALALARDHLRREDLLVGIESDAAEQDTGKGFRT